MSSIIRSLFVVGILVAGLPGCAADSADETAEEKAADTQQDEKQEAASEVKVEEGNLAIQKKGSGDSDARPTPPSKK